MACKSWGPKRHQQWSQRQQQQKQRSTWHSESEALSIDCSIFLSSSETRTCRWGNTQSKAKTLGLPEAQRRRWRTASTWLLRLSSTQTWSSTLIGTCSVCMLFHTREWESRTLLLWMCSFPTSVCSISPQMRTMAAKIPVHM